MDDKLQIRIEKTKLRNALRLKANYRLARKLGFDSYKANIMAQWSEKRIIAYADKTISQ